MQPRALERWTGECSGAGLQFTPLGCRLGARSRPAEDPQRLALSFLSAGLPAQERALLERQSGLELGSDPSLRGRELLVGELARLKALGDSGPALACLLATHVASQSPKRFPQVMGILNLTPDSFSDGGRYPDLSQALARAERMLEEGADLIDVGGESSRPGSEPIEAAEEIRRTEPLIRALAARCQVPISIDTTKAAVARAAIDAGASMVNDISAGRFDPAMLSLVAERDVDLVLMHLQNTPKDMQLAPTYDDAVDAVVEHLRERVRAGLLAGISLRRMAIDPGIGFGKRWNDNLQLMRSIGEMRSLGLPILVGTSRKSMLRALGGAERPEQRDPETLAAQCFALQRGAELHRVHAVQECVAALKITAALGGIGFQACPHPPTEGAS